MGYWDTLISVFAIYSLPALVVEFELSIFGLQVECSTSVQLGHTDLWALPFSLPGTNGSIQTLNIWIRS